MSSGAAIAARDYFSRGWSEHDYDFEVRYRKNVQRILGRAFQHDVVLRTVHLPPFDPEWIVGVVRAGNGYRAFRLEASSIIWGAQESKLCSKARSRQRRLSSISLGRFRST